VLLAAYLALAVALGAWALEAKVRSWPARESSSTVVLARVGALTVSALTAAVGALLLTNPTENDVHEARTIVGVCLVVGSGLLLLGVVLWKGHLAQRLRVVGWLLVVVGLAVPSTLSLLLPLVAPLVVVLGDARTELPASPKPGPG
jgi:hypothetical protein